MKAARLVGLIVLWLLSLMLIALGALLTWAGWWSWENFATVGYAQPLVIERDAMVIRDGWLIAGILAIALGIVLNPLLYRSRPAFLRRWWAYGSFVFACIGLVGGMVTMAVRERAGIADFRAALATNNAELRESRLLAASDHGFARASHVLAEGASAPERQLAWLLRAQAQGSVPAAAAAGWLLREYEGDPKDRSPDQREKGRLDPLLATHLLSQAASMSGLSNRQPWRTLAREQLAHAPGPLTHAGTSAEEWLAADPCSETFCFGVELTCGDECDVKTTGFDSGLQAKDYAADSASVLLRRAWRNVSSLAIEHAAEQTGEAEAMFLHGVDKRSARPADAREWFRRADDAGFERARPELAGMLYRGEGGDADVATALDLLHSSRNDAQPAAWFLLGVHHERTATDADGKAAALAYYRKSAQAGYREAEATLARFDLADPARREKALRHLETMAADGSPYARRELAIAHRDGIGMPVDRPKALERMRESARLGDSEASLQAGIMRMTTEGGVNSNADQAAEHFLAAMPDPAAAANLAKLWLSRMTPNTSTLDPEKLAVEAARAGHPEGLIELADQLTLGLGAYKKDLPRAAAYAWEGYDGVVQRGADQYGAWSYFAMRFARVLQKAFREGAVRERHAGESAELDRLFGTSERFYWITIAAKPAGGGTRTFRVALWDAPQVPVPSDAQLDWIERHHRATPAAGLRDTLRTLHALAREHNVSFIDLVKYKLEQERKSTERDG